ncbi:MAG TPA: hypothetical protein ENN19_10280 [Chloroflexi bacterium]|nr:hypothetical protein [Chloroflexota bacterium]
MVKTLEDGFQRFLERITPDVGTVRLDWDYQAKIEDCLDRYFGLYAFFLGGSYFYGTSIRGYSNVDFLASLGEGRLPDDSISCLTLVKQTLDEQLPGVQAEVQAFAVSILAGEDTRRRVRIVPAKLTGQTSLGHRVYTVPDGTGGWMTSSPDARRAIIETVDGDLEGKLAPLIRLVKAWKYFRRVPISSFYLELRCTQYAAHERMLVYSVDFGRVLQEIWDDQFGEIKDMRGIAGTVASRLARADKKVAVSRLRTALYHVSRAQDATSAGDMEETFLYWNRVFKGRFPSYEKTE